MTKLRLQKYADGSELRDVDDAEWLRSKKLTPDTVLDFDGVTSVSDAFLDRLLSDDTPEAIADRVLGMNEDVDAALSRWVDRGGDVVREVERPRPEPRVRVTKPSQKRVPIERPAVSDDRYTPTRLKQRLTDALRGYIESAYPLSDPILVRARRKVLEDDADGRLLAQEPYIETTLRYRTTDQGYGDLGLPAHVADLFGQLSRTKPAGADVDSSDTIMFPTMYEHQAASYRSVLVDEKDIVVATGTGSGKTECFLVPMLGNLYDEARERPDSFQQPAVRTLILYPMNALVNDQLSRLRLLFGAPDVAERFADVGAGKFPRFGMYTGRTPYPGSRTASKDGDRVAPMIEYYLNLDDELEQELRRLGRYPAKDLESFYGADKARAKKYKSGNKKGESYTRHHWDKRLHTGPDDRELLTRHEMVHGTGTRPGHAPDVLVTNYSMLEYMLMRPFERPIFEETRTWLERDDAKLFLVLDEAHMYRGAKGAEVAFLLRRLRARLGIQDRPDKLRVIATSASLGSDEASLDVMRRFAADLAGKTPDDFVTITGTRTTPRPVAPGSADEADLFASIDLERLHGSRKPGELLACLEPVLRHYGTLDPGDASSEGAVLAALHQALSGRPVVNQLIASAAGDARALRDLAERVFPGHARQVAALERLLALGTLARPEPDAPGLVPTRLHGMFRGLHGLYACIDPECPGRQSDAGERALLGKLFSAPRPTCDACGSRVFEVASCRSCGSPYLYAYAETGALDQLGFLWGETEGDLVRFELLPSKPRYPDRTEEIRVHLGTGYVDASLAYPETETRSFHLSVDQDDRRQPAFDRCPMCQRTGQARSRIYDFRTRGEQAFTALVETQFAEQPPQKVRRELPNHGRKVLVFSDGRQKAARLAPALEHSHARDLFRQVIAIASHELADKMGDTGMHVLYPAVVWLCAQHGYDIFPSADETEFRNHLRRARGKTLAEVVQMANRGVVRPTKSFAQALFSELTDTYYSIPALGLGVVEEDPTYDHVFDSFPDVGLDRTAAKVLFRAWVRLHLERRSFRTDGAELRDLGEGWASPRGIDPDNANHLMPNRFREYVSHVLGDDEAAVQSVADWLKWLVRDGGVLDFEGDLYYLSPVALSLALSLDASWLRCTDCGRVHPESLESTCPACLGTLEDADPAYLDARSGYYRDQVLRAFDSRSLEPFGLSAAEHSAQLTGGEDDTAFNRVEEYELRFQDIGVDGKPPIDVLSCTTTMEVGIDIGSLSGVALRNVPPNVANYQQRAGRAGRRGRSVASVVTYAHGTSHDAHFFDHPGAIISGQVRPPFVYVENQQVLERHIHAFLVQRFFHDQVPTDTGSNAYRLFESMGSVREFLSDQEACSYRRLQKWLDANAGRLTSELVHWVPMISYGLGETIEDARTTIEKAIPHLKTRLAEVLPVDEFERIDELEGLERDALERRLDEPLLQTLITRAVFPRYAFPTDVVAFWVARSRRVGEPAGRQEFEYQPQRDLQLALTEYAPGRSLTIDKWRFESAAVFSPFEPTPVPMLGRRQPYTACRDCNYVSIDATPREDPLCPACGSDQLVYSEFVTPSGFAPDVNAVREVDRGQPIVYAGRTDRARLELQDPPSDWNRSAFAGRLRVWTGPRYLAVVNKGVGDRGFRICPDCGRAEPEYGPGFTQTKLLRAGRPLSHLHPLKKGAECTGVAEGPYYLGHRFLTDALLLRIKVDAPFELGSSTTKGVLGRAARMALTSLVEALSLAASRELQIDEGELSGWWAPVLGRRGDEAQLYLYDLLPGGGGYARAVGESLDVVLDAAGALLQGCDCTSSCYRCIRHYGNNYIHASLDRHLALALLRHITTGELPKVPRDVVERSLTGLGDYLSLRGIPTRTFVSSHGVEVPMVVDATEGPVWVDVHHPLVDPSRSGSPVADAAAAAFQEVVDLDTFTLMHDLPNAVGRLQVSGAT